MNEIYNIIPHRPPFLFIDKIVEVTEQGASATRELRADEPFFQGHYPGNPIMPGVLLCEAVFQTAAIYLVKKLTTGENSMEGLTPVLSRIHQAKFKSMVRPGDRLDIHVDFKETLSKFHYLRGKITCDNRTVLTLDFALALIEEQPLAG